MKTKMLIVVALVLIVGYFLFVKKKGCSCKGTKCSCKKGSGEAPADPVEEPANYIGYDNYTSTDTAYASMYSGKPSGPSKISTDTAYANI